MTYRPARGRIGLLIVFVATLAAGCQSSSPTTTPAASSAREPNVTKAVVFLGDEARFISQKKNHKAVVWRWQADGMTGGPTETIFEASAKWDAPAALNASGTLAMLPREDGFDVWDVDARTILFSRDGEAPEDAFFLADGETLVTRSGASPVTLWNARAGQLLRELALEGPTGSSELRGFAICEEGRLVATVHDDGRAILAVRNLNDGGVRWQREVERGPARLAVDAGAGLVALGSRTFTLFRLSDGDPVRTLAHPEGRSWFREVAFNADGTILAASGTGRTWLTAWHTATGRPVLLDGPFEVQAFAFAEDGRRIVWGADEDVGFALIPPVPAEGHVDHVDTLAFNADGSELVTADRAGTLRVWPLGFDIDWGGPDASPARRVIRVADDRISAVAVAPDGGSIAFATEAGVTLIDVETGRVAWRAGTPSSRPMHLVFSPDGGKLHGILASGSVAGWDAATGEVFVHPLFRHGRIDADALSPDGRLLVAWVEVPEPSPARYLARIFDLATGDVVGEVPFTGQSSFSPDGRRVALRNVGARWTPGLPGDNGDDIVILDARAGTVLHRIEGTDLNWVEHVALSPDGETVAAEVRLTIDGDTTHQLHVYDVETGELLNNLTVESRIRTLAFSPTGGLLVATDWNTTVHVWQVPVDWRTPRALIFHVRW